MLENMVKKKYRMDSIIITFFIVFTWSILLLVLKTVYEIALTPSVKAVSIISCVLVGVFSTSALVAVLAHLKTNRTMIYQEDILNESKYRTLHIKMGLWVECVMVKHEQAVIVETEESERNFWLVTFDVVFIMLLCFATLLSTMLMRGTVIVGSGSAGGLEYTFDSTSFLVTACALAFYLVYIINKSDNELREMIENVYDNENLT